MNDATTVALSPETVLQHMKQNGVTDVVWLPDSETNWLYTADAGRTVAAPGRRDARGPRLLDRRRVACRRAQAADPDPEHRHDGIRRFDPRLAAWAERAGRADGRLSRLDAPRREHRHRGDLHRAVPDAFDLNFYLVENDADAPRIAIAFEEAERTQRPVVVLVGDEYHGFNR